MATAAEDDMFAFLRRRNIDDGIIKELQEDKIDINVIGVMSDAELGKYIYRYGDRLALRAFCRQREVAASRPDETETARSSLVQRLRQRIGARITQTRHEEASHGMGNKNAAKTTRRVELGWLHYSEETNSFHQVRTRNGGGTRNLTVQKMVTMAELMEMGKNLFFSNGLSTKGPVEDFQLNIRDYCHNILSPHVTVGQLYDQTKLRMLRIYTASMKSGEPTRVETSSQPTPSSQLLPTDQPPPSSQLLPTDQPPPSSQLLPTDQPVPSSQPLPTEQPVLVDLTILVQEREQEFDVVAQTFGASMDDFEVQFGPATGEEESNQDDTLPWSQDGHSEESAMATSTPTHPSDQGNQMSNGIGNAPQLSPDMRPSSIPDPMDGQTFYTLTIRRGHCLTDLVHAFKNPDILNLDVAIKMRLPNGALEEGEGSGVRRDCLTEFWTDFYERCTLGGDAKVPFIRHDYQAEEWQAVARIVVFGWKFGYFPVKLAMPFLETTIHGTTSSSFKDAFLQYVSDNERQLLIKALEDFNSVVDEDLLDALEAYDCLQMPTEENFVALLSQLGHKVLLQAPSFIIQNWQPILQQLAVAMPLSVLHDTIKEKTPSAKTVKELLVFPENMTPPQAVVARYLKKYIGEIDLNTLQGFLRFCTGSNLIESKIEVQFIEMSEFEKRPQSHTCACILKVPVGYHNYPELRSDFNSVLRSSVWVIDIV